MDIIHQNGKYKIERNPLENTDLATLKVGTPKQSEESKTHHIKPHDVTVTVHSEMAIPLHSKLLLLA